MPTLAEIVDHAVSLGAPRNVLLNAWVLLRQVPGSGCHRMWGPHGYNSEHPEVKRKVKDALDPSSDTCGACFVLSLNEAGRTRCSTEDGTTLYLADAWRTKEIKDELESIKVRVQSGKKVAARRFNLARKGVANAEDYTRTLHILATGNLVTSRKTITQTTLGAAALNGMDALAREIKALYNEVADVTKDDTARTRILQHVKKSLVPAKWEGALPHFDETPVIIGFSGGFRGPNQAIENLVEAFLVLRDDSKIVLQAPRFLYDHLQRSMSSNQFYMHHVTSVPAPLDADGNVDEEKMRAAIDLWRPGQAGALNDLHAALEATDLL